MLSALDIVRAIAVAYQKTLGTLGRVGDRTAKLVDDYVYGLRRYANPDGAATNCAHVVVI